MVHVYALGIQHLSFIWIVKDPSKYAAIVAKRYVWQCLVPSGTFPLSRALAFTVHSHRYYLLQVSAQGHNYGHLLDMGKLAKEDTTQHNVSLLIDGFYHMGKNPSPSFTATTLGQCRQWSLVRKDTDTHRHTH